MKFQHGAFSCDVDLFSEGKDLSVRFYDSSKEQTEQEIINLVIVDAGYGYLCLKYKGENALLSGLLDEDIFVSEEMVYAAIEFVRNLSPFSKNAYIPHHVDTFKRRGYVEYNGEY